MNIEPGSLDGIETPALLLDLDIMEANLAAMAARLRERGITLRPHAKTHKSAHVARSQLGHGAAGLTVATIGEAEAFARHGFTDLFIAYPVVASGAKADRLAGLARRVKLRVGVDPALTSRTSNPATVSCLAASARAASSSSAAAAPPPGRP